MPSDNTSSTSSSSWETLSRSPRPSNHAPTTEREVDMTATYISPTQVRALNNTSSASRPWYASLDNLPNSERFNAGNAYTNVPKRRDSHDHSPQQRERTFSNPNIEKVKSEELEVADDIPAVWSKDFAAGVQSPGAHNHHHHRTSSIAVLVPVSELRNHHGRRVSQFELPLPNQSFIEHAKASHANYASNGISGEDEKDLQFPLEVDSPSIRQKHKALCSVHGRETEAFECGRPEAVVVSGGGKPAVCRCWLTGDRSTEW